MQPPTTPTPPKPIEPPTPTPAPAAPAPDPVPQPMAVAPEPAPTLSLPTTEVENTGADVHSEHVPEPLTEADAQPAPKQPKPSTPPPINQAGSQAPIGVIVATIVGMLILCGLAIAVYMTSQ